MCAPSSFFRLTSFFCACVLPAFCPLFLLPCFIFHSAQEEAREGEEGNGAKRKAAQELDVVEEPPGSEKQSRADSFHDRFGFNLNDTQEEGDYMQEICEFSVRCSNAKP